MLRRILLALALLATGEAAKAKAESAVAKAADLMQDHSTSVITGAITVLDSAQDDLASL